MAVTELATLVLKPGQQLPSSTLDPHFRLLAERQSAWSGYPLRFYRSAADLREIVLLSGWRDVPAHHRWIASAGNQELLELLAPYLDVKELVHLDVEFERVPDAEQILLWTAATADCETGHVVAKDAEGTRAELWYFAPPDSSQPPASGSHPVLHRVTFDS